jgi:hypothetical protein
MLKKLMLTVTIGLVACHARADGAMKVCSAGQRKAMLAYEYSARSEIHFGNVFVCTLNALNTEAGVASLRNELGVLHKGAVILSITPLVS